MKQFVRRKDSGPVVKKNPRNAEVPGVRGDGEAGLRNAGGDAHAQVRSSRRCRLQYLSWNAKVDGNWPYLQVMGPKRLSHDTEISQLILSGENM